MRNGALWRVRPHASSTLGWVDFLVMTTNLLFDYLRQIEHDKNQARNHEFRSINSAAFDCRAAYWTNRAALIAMQETVTIEHSVEQKSNRPSCESVCRLIVILLEDPALCIDLEIDSGGLRGLLLKTSLGVHNEPEPLTTEWNAAKMAAFRACH